MATGGSIGGATAAVTGAAQEELSGNGNTTLSAGLDC